jgi:hypothetical protein
MCAGPSVNREAGVFIRAPVWMYGADKTNLFFKSK